jgi:TolB-like protein
VRGTHVWAGRYDRALDDIFELQDEINPEGASVNKVVSFSI